MKYKISIYEERAYRHEAIIETDHDIDAICDEIEKELNVCGDAESICSVMRDKIKVLEFQGCEDPTNSDVQIDDYEELDD